MVLKIALTKLDPITVTFFRFFVAAVLMLGFQAPKLWNSKKLSTPPMKRWGKLLFLGGLSLTLNHAFFVWGLRYSSGSNAQLFIQLAPFFFGVVSVFVFKESFSRKQGAGALLLAIGLGLYFSDNLRILAERIHDYLFGCFLILIAAASWVAYACCQRILNSELGPARVTTAFYCMASVFLLPFCNFGGLSELQGVHWFCLLYGGLNTLVAYGAFSAAIIYWESSRVSASLALTPVATFLFTNLFHSIVPNYVRAEPVEELGLLGASLVILGSMVTALARESKPKPLPAKGL